MRISYPSGIQWCILWFAALTAGHVWLGLDLSDFVPRTVTTYSLSDKAPAEAKADFTQFLQSQSGEPGKPPPGSFSEFLGAQAADIELGRAIKAKYPGSYDDLSDADLGRKVRAKYRKDALTPDSFMAGQAPSAVPVRQMRRAWDGPWGLPGYLRPAINYHPARLAFTILVFGALLTWQASGWARPKPPTSV